MFGFQKGAFYTKDSNPIRHEKTRKTGQQSCKKLVFLEIPIG